ncbi:hypothetical protein ACHAW6_015144 [Cyclotella cf. meneghiniana]
MKQCPGRIQVMSLMCPGHVQRRVFLDNFLTRMPQICETKAARKLTQSGTPRQLWCFALEFGLDDRILETVVLGETDDIGPFCEFDFGIGPSFGTVVLLFLATPWYLGNTLVPALTWDL